MFAALEKSSILYSMQGYCFFVCVFFFLPELGLCSSMQAFSSCGEWGCSLVEVCGLLIAVPSVVAEHRLQGVWSHWSQQMDLVALQHVDSS